MARFTHITRLGAWAVLLILASTLLVPSTALACHKGRAHGPHTCGPPDPGPGPGTPSMNVLFTDSSLVGNYVLSPTVHSPGAVNPTAPVRSCQLTTMSPDESTGTYTCQSFPWPSALQERLKFHLLDSEVVQTRGKANYLNCIRWDGYGGPEAPWGPSDEGRLINPDLLFTITWDSACQDGCTALITMRFSEQAAQLSQNFVNVADVTLEAVGVIGGGNAGANPFREDQVVDISEIEITHFAREKGNIDSICRWQFEPGDITLETTNTTPSP